jgi:hypothetical protein
MTMSPFGSLRWTMMRRLRSFETLGSETTYLIYKQLHEEPQLPRELASTLDSSIQNIHYHLNKLEDAGLIEPVETWHSQNGVEMEVYAPIHHPLVLSFASADYQRELRSLLTHAFGMLGIVGFVSLLAEFFVNWWLPSARTGLDETAGSGSGSPGESEILFNNIVVDTVLSSPGVTVFLLGITLVSVYTVYRFTRQTPSQR